MIVVIEAGNGVFDIQIDQVKLKEYEKLQKQHTSSCTNYNFNF